MSKTIRVKLVSIQYKGDSIGDDIRIEIKIADKSFKHNYKIKSGTTRPLQEDLGAFESSEGGLDLSVGIKMVERDFVADDIGTTSSNIAVDANLGVPQAFNFEVKVKERKKTAIFVVGLEASVSIPGLERIMPRVYKGVLKGQDLNKFDNEIADEVYNWNKEFAYQQLPPDTLLDPSLVKAMIYVESTMGYGIPKNDNDIMQVAHPDDPALHTLNNDGWISPETTKVARENEWINGKVQTLDYHGEAKVLTTRDSIHWGVRWLYHRAQSIEGRGREWFDWKEAVRRYGPGKNLYEEKVWSIYTKGIVSNTIKLWSWVLLIPFAVAGIWLALHQGKLYLTFEDYPGTEDYGVRGRIVSGLWYQSIYLAKVYANAGNSLALDKHKPITIEYIDIDSDHRKEIIVSGSYLLDHDTKYILRKAGGQYKLVYVLEEDSEDIPQEAFNSQKVYFKDLDNDGVLEVVTDYLLLYANAPNQIWTSYYYFDGAMYKFVKKDKADTTLLSLGGGGPPADAFPLARYVQEP
jgi:hypothetical protein